ncbi:type II 3-dehydroquinate dehydratase [Streptomyces sp. NPDC102259]|uniref:type II 3-dehydroquinate dehydratase n=1 Tax=Streptomyces sp. NPDC102259 TaxID=3366148 RepID=UPI0037F9F8D2
MHPTNLWARERFRHESLLAPLASGVVVGLGAFGHRLAARALVRLSEAGAGRS